MSAKTSGADPKPNGNSAQNRQHHDGSNGRAFTVEQKDAVVRIRKCAPTAFYDILGLESERTTVTDGGIKKAYRKLSLLTHPDKNGYTGSDEAFKMVSRAFQILSDPDKKIKYDKFGGDPDSRFGSAGPSASPFSGFARSPRAAGGGRGFEEEITPEELFRQFFGGGMGGGFGGPFGGPFGGGGLFDASPGGGFVFNMGGGPGVRVHQFGGNRPRRRPPGAGGGAQQQQEEAPTAATALANLMPLLIFLIIPLLSSLFSGSGTFFDSAPKVPAFSLDVPHPPHLTQMRTSPLHGVTYYVSPADVAPYTSDGSSGKRKWRDLDNAAERRLSVTLDAACRREESEKQQLLADAQGWFFVDRDKYDEASAMEMRACKREAFRVVSALGLRALAASEAATSEARSYVSTITCCKYADAPQRRGDASRRGIKVPFPFQEPQLIIVLARQHITDFTRQAEEPPGTRPQRNTRGNLTNHKSKAGKAPGREESLSPLRADSGHATHQKTLPISEEQRPREATLKRQAGW